MDQIQEYQKKILEKQKEALLISIYGGLMNSVSRSGGELTGLSIRFNDEEVLMVIKAQFPGKRMVSFVGSHSLAECFVKGTRDAGSDDLRWKVDRYAKS